MAKDAAAKIDLGELEHQKEIKQSRDWAGAAYSGFSITEALNFSSIFFMLHVCAEFLFNTPMRFVVFPLAALYGLTKMGIKWTEFSIVHYDFLYREKKGFANEADRKKALEEYNITFLQALWETLNSLGTTGAVITGIVGFIAVIPVGMGISITFNFFLAASTAICALYAAYFGYRAYQTHEQWEELSKNEPNKEDLEDLYKQYEGYYKGALIHLAWFGIVGLLTIGVAVSMVAGFTLIGGIIGIAGCLIAAGFQAYNLYCFAKSDKPTLPKQEEQPKVMHIVHSKLGTDYNPTDNPLYDSQQKSVSEPKNDKTITLDNSEKIEPSDTAFRH